MRLRVLAPLILAAMAACGGSGSPTDENGLVRGDDETALFARASQLYFRGSLSRSRDEFNAVIYRYPGSMLVDEARLAVRRIDIDLGAIAADTTGPARARPSVVVVGLPVNGPRITRLVAALNASGYDASAAEDEGAPDMTVLLYPDGLEAEAGRLADSLHSWLAQPAEIPVQPGGQIAQTILPGHSGLVVVLGSDAVIGASAPQSAE